VRAAVEALLTQFFEPLAANELLSDAWAGATTALLRAKRSEVPGPPAFPADMEAACAVHDQTFSTLERFADGLLSADDLASAGGDLGAWRLTPRQPGRSLAPERRGQRKRGPVTRRSGLLGHRR